MSSVLNQSQSCLVEALEHLLYQVKQGRAGCSEKISVDHYWRRMMLAQVAQKEDVALTNEIDRFANDQGIRDLALLLPASDLALYQDDDLCRIVRTFPTSNQEYLITLLKATHHRQQVFEFLFPMVPMWHVLPDVDLKRVPVEWLSDTRLRPFLSVHKMWSFFFVHAPNNEVRRWCPAWSSDDEFDRTFLPRIRLSGWHVRAFLKPHRIERMLETFTLHVWCQLKSANVINIRPSQWSRIEAWIDRNCCDDAKFIANARPILHDVQRTSWYPFTNSRVITAFGLFDYADATKQIVQFVHETRGKPCTVQAVDDLVHRFAAPDFCKSVVSARVWKHIISVLGLRGRERVISCLHRVLPMPSEPFYMKALRRYAMAHFIAQCPGCSSDEAKAVCPVHVYSDWKGWVNLHLERFGQVSFLQHHTFETQPLVVPERKDVSSEETIDPSTNCSAFIFTARSHLVKEVEHCLIPDIAQIVVSQLCPI